MIAEHDAALAELVLKVWEDWVLEHGGIAVVGDSPGGFPAGADGEARFKEARRVALTKARGALSAAFVAGYVAGKDDPGYLNSGAYRLRVAEIEAARARKEPTISPTEEEAFAFGALAARQDWKPPAPGLGGDGAVKRLPGADGDGSLPGADGDGSLLGAAFLAAVFSAPYWLPALRRRFGR